MTCRRDLSDKPRWAYQTTQTKTPPFRPQISNFSPVSFIGALSLTEGASLVIHTWIRNIFRTHRRLLDLMSVGGAFFPQAVYLWYVRYFRFYERYLRENLIWARKLETNLDQPKSNMTAPMHRSRTRGKRCEKLVKRLGFLPRWKRTTKRQRYLTVSSLYSTTSNWNTSPLRCTFGGFVPR